MTDFYYGSAYGQQVVGGGVTRIINGLTVSPAVVVMNASASKGIAYIGDANVTTSTGYPLEPGQSVRVDTSNSNTRWYVTTDGLTARLSYISTQTQNI